MGIMEKTRPLTRWEGWLVLVLVGVMMLTGCKTKERVVTVTQQHTDTVYVARVLRDSVWKHDSVYVKEFVRGDTVFVDRAVWHTAIQERLRVDTFIKATHDTIPQPYKVEVIKKVEKELTWWQKTRMHAGEVMIFVVIALFGWKFLLPLLRRI